MTSRRKTVILVSCCLSLLIVSMDATIVNVAIPAIRTDLHASPAQMQWVVDIYTLVLASLLMLSGRHRRSLRSPAGVPDRAHAVRARVAGVQPGADDRHADRRPIPAGHRRIDAQSRCAVDHLADLHRSRWSAPGRWASGVRVVGISMALGPIVGGLLIETDRLAVGVLDQPAHLRGGDPAHRDLRARVQVGDHAQRRPDRPGTGRARSCSASSSRSSRARCWAGPTPASSSSRWWRVVAFVAFLRYESRRHDPFIDLRFFRSIPFTAATVTAVSAFAAWGAFLFMMSLYLQGERGYSAMHTGLIYLPIAMGALLFSPLSGRLVGRFGARPSLVAAGVLITAASAMLTFLTATTPVWELLVVFTVFGIGFSMVNAPITNAAVSGMPLDRAGAASAVTSTSRQVGVSIGVALCGSVAGSAMATAGADFATAARPLWFVCVALGSGDPRARVCTRPRAGAALGRAAGAADRRDRRAGGASPCPMTRSPTRCGGIWPRWCIDNRDGWKRAVVEQSGLPFSRIRILQRLSASADDGQAGRRGRDHRRARGDRRRQRPGGAWAGGAPGRSGEPAVQGGVADRRRPRRGRRDRRRATIRPPDVAHRPRRRRPGQRCGRSSTS